MTTEHEPMFSAEVRDAFRDAALKGIKQLYGSLRDGQGGFCAVGWLMHCETKNYPTRSVNKCYLCGVTRHGKHNFEINDADTLLVHFNNDHKFDWLELAKVPEPFEFEEVV